MRRRSRYLNSKQNLNIWAPFTDLMSNAFMILSLFLLLALLRLSIVNAQLEEKVKALQAAQPIIIDAQSDNFNFGSNSAVLTTQLQNYLSDEVVPKIENIAREKDLDFVSVIGHTDDNPILNPNSNLDKILPKVAKSSNPEGANSSKLVISLEQVTELKAGSNADLGLMRALAVVQFLQKEGSLQNVKFRAYSAAQLYLPPKQKKEDKPEEKDKRRRRIEIRFIPPGVKE